MHLEITPSLRLSQAGVFYKAAVTPTSLRLQCTDWPSTYITVIDVNAFDCSDNNYVKDMTNMMNILWMMIKGIQPFPI